MGKKLDAILGRTFKPSKFKPLVNLAFSRLLVLKNQRQVRYNQARSDVVQLLELGYHERALLRVEQVIKEQNMLDVFVMIESYCNLLVERVSLIEQERVCPDELKEAISSLLYAASRCGEFPELQEIRAVLTSRFGKEFASNAIELRNNCGVNHKMMQKLSTRLPGLERRMEVLKEIASEHNIVLQFDGPSTSTEESLDVNKKQNQPESNSGSTKLGDDSRILPQEKEKDYGFSDSTKGRQYRDVADAAQAAFESAAYAAAAARAAVELSRSGPHDPDDQDSPNTGRGKVWKKHEIKTPESELVNEEMHNENQDEEMKQNNTSELKKSMSASSSDSAEDISKVTTISSDVIGQVDPLEKEMHFDDSDNETGHEESNILPHKQIPSGFQAGLKVGSGLGQPRGHAAEGSGTQSPQTLNIFKTPISVRRIRQVRGY